MGDTYLVLAVDGVPTANTAGDRPGAHGTVVAPARTALSVWTVSGHMTGVATDTADDVRSVVLLLWTVVFAMTDLSAVLASLILVITQSTVQSSELTKLVTLELVLSLRNGCCLQELLAPLRIEPIPRRVTYRLDDVVNELLRFVDLFLGIGHD